MSHHFPLAREINLNDKIQSLEFSLPDAKHTKIILSTLLPGARVQSHAHVEAQMGLCLSGKFLLSSQGQSTVLNSLQNAYCVQSQVEHSAINPFAEAAIGLDIKRHEAYDTHYTAAQFLSPLKPISLRTGIKMYFFVSAWCEVMVSEIPRGACMPVHHHFNEQIGVAVKGKYVMQVGNEEQLFEYGKVYYSPKNTPHGAYNPYDETAISLNIFLPRRYTKNMQFNQQRGWYET